MSDEEWVELARRNARCVQTLVGWIFWDPGAVSRYEELGLNGPLGYIASRVAPFAGAGPQAAAAAFGSISPLGIGLVFAHLGTSEAFDPFWRARNAAVLDGLAAYAPVARRELAEIGPRLWPIVDRLPALARPLFASHRDAERPEHPALSGWHAVNCLREWRGDTHWILVASVGLTGDEASILHNAWLGYDGDWLSLSRGNSPDSIDAAWRSLEDRGLAADHRVTEAGLRLRQWIEDETDRRTTTPWEMLGESESRRFHDVFEPPCELLLARVDETAGPRFQPASRPRARYEG